MTEPETHSENEDWEPLSPAALAYRWRERTVLEYVDEAINYADYPGSMEECATPDTALRWLLKLAWYELQRARGEAINSRWSMTCDSLVCQIIGLTRLVGPTPWEEVQVDLLLDGIYERIHEAIGTPTPLSDDDRQRAQAVKERTTL